MILTFLQQDFIQNAFLAGTMVAIVTAVVGYFVVLRTQAFASDSLSHIAFAGSTGGPLFGFSSLIGMFILTLLSALGMGALGERVRGRDVETGMVLAFALGLGVLFTSLYASGRNATATVGALFGSILSVNRGNVLTTLVSGIVVLLLLTFLFRPLLFASIDPEVAQTRGVPVRLLSILFLLLLAVTIAMAVQVVGALLVFALLIAPAASAARFTYRPFTTIALSTVLGLAITWIGLLLTVIGTGRYLPASFYIATLATFTYFVAVLTSRWHTLRRSRQVTSPRATCEQLAGRNHHVSPSLTKKKGDS
ncbi:MAG: metal ABC transporter permease [Ktedonobacteraceae bacterium]